MNAKKHDQHGKQRPAPPAEPAENETDTEKIAAGEPVAVVGTEVEGTTAAQDSDGGAGVGVAMNAPLADAPAAGDAVESEEDREAIRDAAAKVFEDGGEPAAEPRTDHLKEGRPVYMAELSACIWLAGLPKPDAENFELIPFELAMFFRGEPDAPDAAGLSHLKLKLKTDLLPDEDPRRVELAVKLFRTAINGLDAIEKADGDARQAKEQAAALKPAHNRLEKGEGIYDREPGRLEKSDLGKALDKQRA